MRRGSTAKKRILVGVIPGHTGCDDHAHSRERHESGGRQGPDERAHEAGDSGDQIADLAAEDRDAEPSQAP